MRSNDRGSMPVRVLSFAIASLIWVCFAASPPATRGRTSLSNRPTLAITIASEAGRNFSESAAGDEHVACAMAAFENEEAMTRSNASIVDKNIFLFTRSEPFRKLDLGRDVMT